jgi:hypothetical protein
MEKDRWGRTEDRARAKLSHYGVISQLKLDLFSPEFYSGASKWSCGSWWQSIEEKNETRLWNLKWHIYVWMIRYFIAQSNMSNNFYCGLVGRNWYPKVGCSGHGWTKDIKYWCLIEYARLCIWDDQNFSCGAILIILSKVSDFLAALPTFRRNGIADTDHLAFGR